MEEFLTCIYAEHGQLNNVKQNSAVYNALKIVCDWEHYGEEYYDVAADGSSYIFGTGPKGITLYDKQLQSQSKYVLLIGSLNFPLFRYNWLNFVMQMDRSSS